MQLSQLTTAVVAGSAPPRQWSLLPVPGKEIFALGMIVGVMVVVLARGWLWWRGPKRAGRTDARATHQPYPRHLARQAIQAASAPVSVAVRPSPVTVASTSPSAVAEELGSTDPDSTDPDSTDPDSTDPGSTDPGSTDPGNTDSEPEVVAAVRKLLTSLENRKVTLATGKPALVDRFLTAAVGELASGSAPCGPCDLILVGFPECTSAGGLTMRRGDLGAALDLLAARAVTARRRVADSGGSAVNGGTSARAWGLTVLVSRVAPTPAEVAMVADLVNEPGRVAALLPAIGVGQPPAAASVLELSRPDNEPDSQPSGLVARIRTSGEPAPEPHSAPESEPESQPEPDLSRTAGQPRPASLRIGVLGQLTINSQPGALLPAQTQLIVALALHGEAGLTGKQLCQLLGSDADHPKPADSLRQLIARTRRQLGQTSDGGEWIEHLGHGRYALQKETRLDWHEFERFTEQGIGAKDASQLAAALAMVRGQPFTGCYYWWLDIELIDRVTAKIVTAAATLAQLNLGKRDPAAAARAARIGLVADVTSERLWRQLMRAEHAAGNLAGVREAWSRCVDAVSEIAADGEPDPATTALYHQLLDR